MNSHLKTSPIVSHRIKWEMTIILQNNITILWTVRPRHVLYCDPLISILVFVGITEVQVQLSEYVYYTVTMTDCCAYNSITVLISLNRPRKYGLLLCYHFPYSSSRTVPPNSYIFNQSDWRRNWISFSLKYFRSIFTARQFIPSVQSYHCGDGSSKLCK